MKNNTLIEAIAINTIWLLSVNENYRDKAEEIADKLVSMLPNGSGFCNVKIDEDSNCSKVVIHYDYHFCEDRLTLPYRVVCRPKFGYVDIQIKGRDRDGVKEYMTEVFISALLQEVCR